MFGIKRKLSVTVYFSDELEIPLKVNNISEVYSYIDEHKSELGVSSKDIRCITVPANTKLSKDWL